MAHGTLPAAFDRTATGELNWPAASTLCAVPAQVATVNRAMHTALPDDRRSDANLLSASLQTVTP